MLNASQRAELKAAINTKLEKLEVMIGKLNGLEEMRKETVEVG